MKLHDKLAPSVPSVSIEQGIVKLVGILNSKGLATVLSCEGHAVGASNAWVQIEGAHFKKYAKAKPKCLEKFLLAGEGMWQISVCYRGESVFQGIGRTRPRLSRMKRKVVVNLVPTFLLNGPAFADGTRRKTKSLLAMERAAAKFL